MKGVQFSEAELASMRSFYQAELDQTVRKLQHLKGILDKLDGASHIEITIGNETRISSSIAIAEPTAEVDDMETAEEEAPRKRKKKRGPKPVWGNFVLKRLRQVERPLTYRDLVDDAMAFMKLPEEKRKATRLAILNTSFRLRNLQNKINTHSVKGKKEVYVGLSKWFEENGNLSKDYVKRIR